METNNPFPQPVSEEIWDRKYKLKTRKEGVANDYSVYDTWDRIAKACSQANLSNYGRSVPFHPSKLDYQRQWEKQFNSALEDFKFLPAGRITAGTGSGRSVTLFNCYVMGNIADNLDDIFANLREAALTMQQGGGIGYNFTTLRPSGAPVKGVDAHASGPLSFMDVWDAMCRTIMSAGARRGAMMGTMHCDHPDIMAFIKAKHQKGRLNMFNMSVLASDAFMQAMLGDEDWPLLHEVAPEEPVEWTTYSNGVRGAQTMVGDRYIYEVVKAKDLWDAMMENTYNHAEPGVLFVDRINKMNNLWYIETISATNPCGEQPLPEYGACLLGSINLSRMVINAFTDNPEIDYDEIRRITRIAVRLLDSVIDISNFPLEEQEKEAKFKRRMGIGVTGLADMLFMLNQVYGTEEAAKTAGKVMREITLAAYWESVELAKEFGPCPATATRAQREKFIQSGFMQQSGIPSTLRDAIIQYGIRNALLTSIAPTGTISMYAGNVSSGVEPIFAARFMRKILEDDGVTKVEQLVEDYAILIHRQYWEALGIDPESQMEYLVTAQTLTPDEHLIMQAAVQEWIDSSISKTINCPKDIGFEDFKNIYLTAYEIGCKGCTTYRPNDTIGSVLEVVEDAQEVDVPIVEDSVKSAPVVHPIPRTKILEGSTYKLKWKKDNFYVTINNQMVDGRLSPFEIFINTQNMDNFQYVMALTRMMSSVFRRSRDINFVIADLKAIMDPNGGVFVDGKYQHSFIAYLGRTIELHIQNLNTDDMAIIDTLTDRAEAEAEMTAEDAPRDRCLECGEYDMVNNGGCPTCQSCGYSKCG